MSKTNFDFIDKSDFRDSIDDVFGHVIQLLPLLNLNDYDSRAKSHFRKTIIIYTASIIEAMLLYLLERLLISDDFSISTWKLKNKKVLHKVSDEQEIVAGDYVLSKKEIDTNKLNLQEILDILREQKILEKALFEKIQVIQKWRNEQHIAKSRKITNFSNRDIEKSFSVAKEVKDFVEKQSQN